MAILEKMVYLAKMTELAINRQNRQTVNKNANEMAKGPFGKVAILVKMAELALDRQNCQMEKKNTNEMAKGPFVKWRCW